MKRILILFTFLAACGDNIVDEPSVDAGLPACEDVGCPDVAFCNAAGVCSCNATGEPVSCQR